jgi:DNA-binding NarL/FixJ family response regulator
MWMSPTLLTALLSECRADADQQRAREQLNRLTPRETEVLRLMVNGHNRRQIADQLHVSSETVRTHAQSLQKKLQVHSGVAAVSLALKAGLRPDVVASA